MVLMTVLTCVQIQLGWAPVQESDDPRWNIKALRNPEEARKQKG
jgi:hypothetical protein